MSKSSPIDFSSSTTRIWGISRPVSLIAAFVPCINASSNSREFDDKLSAAVFFGYHANCPAVGLHDLVDNRKPKTRAPLEPRLQRLKHPGPLFRVVASAR